MKLVGDKTIKYIPFWSSNLASGHLKGQKWAQNGAEGGQKHKIDNIEENNEVKELQLHRYVIQVGRRQKQ